MKFRPALPEHNDNVSHTHPVGEFVLLFLGIFIVLFLIFWSAGLFVDYAVGYITPEMEEKIRGMDGQTTKADDRREGLADHEALKAVNCCYGHVGGALEFFNAMAIEGEDKIRLAGHYFGSHPQAMERIDTLGRIAVKLGMQERGTIPCPKCWPVRWGGTWTIQDQQGTG